MGVATLLLTACAPDPVETREALKEVTAEPVAPEAVDPYDAEAFPDPVVVPKDCSPYLVITARGTGEPPRKQLLGPVVRAIQEARPDEVQKLDLDYPADTEINAGATQGARTLIDTLNVQAEHCPEQQTILLGYSQGALLIGDALASAEARLVGQTVGEVSEEASDQILAVVFYGNPRFVGVDPTGFGSFDVDTNGLLPRPPASFTRYEDRMRDYCVGDDFICQATLSIEDEGHVAYYTNGMQSDGAAYVITRMGPLAKKSDAKADDEAADTRAENASGAPDAASEAPESDGQ